MSTRVERAGLCATLLAAALAVLSHTRSDSVSTTLVLLSVFTAVVPHLLSGASPVPPADAAAVAAADPVVGPPPRPR